ncbi:MAG TPA: shikimate dehydrogenase [Usitatibacter sp.]|jgi:shikimate dehydrogenase|nr:shikimate dehydrogenase [Usitatibacter sp.]
MDRYAVIGHPISHSLSPHIHARFAQQSGEQLAYEALEAPADGFRTTLERFFSAGGRGANVTLPFKVEAFALAHETTPRARLAGAANFLAREGGRIRADNTDGAGLVRDLAHNLALALEGARVLLVGAGGAARGVVAPLLEAGVARIVIANRTPARAGDLARQFAHLGEVRACALDAIPESRYDLVVNATSTSTRGEPLEVPATLFGAGMVAYDMAYGEGARAFVQRARALGARACDGLGMLVEQAAESFELWRGVRPLTAPVLAELRARFP